MQNGRYTLSIGSIKFLLPLLWLTGNINSPFLDPFNSIKSHFKRKYCWRMFSGFDGEIFNTQRIKEATLNQTSFTDIFFRQQTPRSKWRQKQLVWLGAGQTKSLGGSWGWVKRSLLAEEWTRKSEWEKGSTNSTPKHHYKYSFNKENIIIGQSEHTNNNVKKATHTVNRNTNILIKTMYSYINRNSGGKWM